MNHSCRGIERGAHVRYRFEFLIFDCHAFGGILRLSSAARHHGRDGFTLPAHAINRDRVLRGGFEAFQVRENADPRRDDS
jgi:hypothetical protein